MGSPNSTFSRRLAELAELRLHLSRRAIRVEMVAADGWRWAGLPETGDWRPVGVGRLCRRPEIGDRLAWGGPSMAVHGQAVGMEGVAGLPRLVRSGCAWGAAAQHSVQPTGEDLGRLTMLAAPAADGWR